MLLQRRFPRSMNRVFTNRISFRSVNEGRRLVATSDTPSYAAELEVLSKDEVRIQIHCPNSLPFVCRNSIYVVFHLSFFLSCEILQLMCKLKDQILINDRLREYIERMLTVIMEHSPQLLEVTNSSGVSIVSMGMSAMTSNNSRSQPIRTIVPTENPSSLSSTITAESVKDIPPDKYCRL